MWPSRHISSHLPNSPKLCVWVPLMPVSTFQDVDFEKANEKIKLGEEGTHASALLCRGSVNEDFEPIRSIVASLTRIFSWSRSVVYGCWLKFVGIVCTSESTAEECCGKVQRIRRTRN